jgi:hypothetical protein
MRIYRERYHALTERYDEIGDAHFIHVALHGSSLQRICLADISYSSLSAMLHHVLTLLGEAQNDSIK